MAWVERDRSDHLLSTRLLCAGSPTCGVDAELLGGTQARMNSTAIRGYMT